MVQARVQGGPDTYVDEGRASKNFAGTGSINVDGGGGATPAKVGLLKLQNPIPAGATVINASLYLTQGDAVNNPKSFTLNPLTEDCIFGNVSWDNRPTDTPTNGSVASTSGAANSIVGFDVTAYFQAVANGNPNWGWKLRCDQTNGVVFYSSDNPNVGAQPLLVVEYSTAPSAPTKLRPAGTVVGIPKPVVQCDYTDRSGSTQLASIRVLTDPGGDFGGPDLWDSGEVPVNQPALDLATTSFPAMYVGQSVYWKVAVKDGDNMWSGWSEATYMTYYPKGVVTITKPSGSPPTVAEYTPAIEWTFTNTQTHFQVQVTSPDGQHLYYDSGKIQSPVLGWTLPKRVLTNNGAYRVVVYVWDTYPREATQGDPSYAVDDTIFTVQFDGSVAPPDLLEATQVGITPFVQLEWARGVTPNTFTVTRDDGYGEFAIDTDLTPGEAGVVGQPGLYRFIDWTVKPYVPHTYRVRAEVGGALSDEGYVDTIVTKPEGIWIVDPGTHEFVVLGGREFSTSQPDNAQTYTVLGSLDIVRSVMGLSGLSGNMSNMLLRTREGVSWDEYERRMYRFKERPAAIFRLVLGDLNIPVVLGNIMVAPHPQTRGDQPLKSVSFDWWQTSEHPFTGAF